jgi:GxxExxY protein
MSTFCSPRAAAALHLPGAGLHRSVTGEIISAAIEVHRTLGPGLLESAYQAAICRELAMRSLDFVQQVELPMSYKGVDLDCGYRVDLIVRNLVIVELKAVQQLLPVHEAQLITYLRLTGLRAGLLINFNVAVLKDGIRRRVL